MSLCFEQCFQVLPSIVAKLSEGMSFDSLAEHLVVTEHIGIPHPWAFCAHKNA